ncbi:hypothetical protein [Acidibrevibacterium fodinaquatile]|uniref:hypothetical protein n=1 Tax=Acidibrevibacterium fodinaquatile TaxID=1969806 RepID=UPI001F07EE55|nr:hypothetical protein [Acidibrevibacterium fodinaquatile]
MFGQFCGVRATILRANRRVRADSDEVGHAFQLEAGHCFRTEAGRGSDLKPAT